MKYESKIPVLPELMIFVVYIYTSFPIKVQSPEGFSANSQICVFAKVLIKSYDKSQFNQRARYTGKDNKFLNDMI